MSQKIKGRNIGCLPQSVYKDSVKNKTIKSTIAWMIDQINACHGCTTGDCPHETQQECVDAMHQQFLESNVTCDPLKAGE